MHTVQLLLKTSKYERHEIDRRFHALAHLHNVCAVSDTHLDVYKRQSVRRLSGNQRSSRVSSDGAPLK